MSMSSVRSSKDPLPVYNKECPNTPNIAVLLPDPAHFTSPLPELTPTGTPPGPNLTVPSCERLVPKDVRGREARV